MPTYSNVYLLYSEDRVHASEDETIELESNISEEDEEEYENYDGSHSSARDSTFVEFSPLKLLTKEPKGTSVELELDFELKKGEALYVVVVRYNSYGLGVFDDWCVEGSFLSLEEAEDLVEAIEDSVARSECADTQDAESSTTRSEVFNLTLE